MQRIYLLVLLLVISISVASGQNSGTVADSVWQKRLFDVPGEVLPLLVKAAIQNAPEVGVVVIEKEIVKQDAKIAQKGILNSINLVSGYNYGTAGNLALTESNTNNPVNSFTTAKSSRYTVGVNFSLPLDRALSRNNQLKKKELEYHQTELQQKFKEREITQQVIDLYEELQLSNRILLLASESLNSLQVHKKMAEKEFVEGEIPVSEVVRVNEMYTKAAIANEEAKSKFKRVYLHLEQRVGAKLSELLIGK